MKTPPQICFALCLILCYIRRGENAKILALFTLPSGSHMNIMKALVKPLLARGHEIDLVSYFPLQINHERYLDLDLSGGYPTLKGNVVIEKTLIGDTKITTDFMDVFAGPTTNAVLESNVIENLKNSSKKYDLILRHIFLNDPLEALTHTFKVPSIGLITSVILPWSADIVGMQDNPAFVPNYYSTYGENMSFFERIFNTIMYVTIKFKYMALQKLANEQIIKHFGYETPPVEELLKRTSLILCNSHHTIHQARSMPPNFIEIGGIHIDGERNVTLPQHLETALNSATQGLIYVSFGSLIKSETIDVEKLEAMFETFRDLPHKIFWKGNREDFPKSLKIPDNFYIESWMPQLEILCHPNTKLFMSHGGLFGIQEAVHCGVPILGIPFAFDQGSNLQLIVEKDVAKSLTYEDISKDTFSEAVKTLLQERYKTNAENLSKLFKDRPMSPIDTAIYWIEYVIKHGGAPHLKSSATKLRWYQYYLLDIIGFFLIIALIFSIILYFVILRLYRTITNVSKLSYIYDLIKIKIKID